MNSELQKSAPVDLEQFREAVLAFMQKASNGMNLHANPASEFERECYEVAAADFDEAQRLLSIIDNAGKVDIKGYPLWAAIHAAHAKAGIPCNVGLAQVIEALDTFLHQPAPVVDDALVEYVRREIALAKRELDSVTATDDVQSDGIGCAENALERALYALAHGVQS